MLKQDFKLMQCFKMVPYHWENYQAITVLARPHDPTVPVDYKTKTDTNFTLLIYYVVYFIIFIINDQINFSHTT